MLTKQLSSMKDPEQLTLDEKKRLLALLGRIQGHLDRALDHVERLTGRVTEMPVLGCEEDRVMCTGLAALNLAQEQEGIAEIIEQARKAKTLDLSSRKPLSSQKVKLLELALVEESLEIVNLESVKLDSRGVESLARLIERSSLKVVNLANMQLSEEGFLMMCVALRNSVSTLEYLGLERVGQVSEPILQRLVDFLPSCPNLKNLSLAGIGLKEEEASLFLEAFLRKGRCNLDGISIDGIQERGMGLLLGLLASCPTLKGLFLASALEDQQILRLCQTLLQYSDLSKLLTLGLEVNLVDESTLDALSQVFMRCENLKMLGIRQADGFLSRLIPYLPMNLEVLVIDRSTRELRDQIRQHHPQVKLVEG